MVRPAGVEPATARLKGGFLPIELRAPKLAEVNLLLFRSALKLMGGLMLMVRGRAPITTANIGADSGSRTRPLRVAL